MNALPFSLYKSGEYADSCVFERVSCSMHLCATSILDYLHARWVCRGVLADGMLSIWHSTRPFIDDREGRRKKGGRFQTRIILRKRKRCIDKLVDIRRVLCSRVSEYAAAVAILVWVIALCLPRCCYRCCSRKEIMEIRGYSSQRNESRVSSLLFLSWLCPSFGVSIRVTYTARHLSEFEAFKGFLKNSLSTLHLEIWRLPLNFRDVALD